MSRVHSGLRAARSACDPVCKPWQREKPLGDALVQALSSGGRSHVDCADGSLGSLLVRLSRIDVLVIDDWAMAPLAETERREIELRWSDRKGFSKTFLKAGDRDHEGRHLRP